MGTYGESTFVKSEVGLAWNGSTIWVVQENLVEYISRSTALNLYYFENTTLADVNILSLTYSDSNTTNQPEMLKKVGFYSGPI